MPEMGRYNGAEAAVLVPRRRHADYSCSLSGIVIWRACFSANFPISVVRLGALLHAAFAALMITAIIVP